MKIICAGFPKTGTKTLACALRHLDFQVYDFIENFWYLNAEWEKVFEGRATTNDFRKMLKDVDAVCDLPACYFWEEIYQAFPDAKIILAYREIDSEENWWMTMSDQVNKVNNFLFRLILAVTPTGNRLLRFMRSIGRVTFGQSPMPRFGRATSNETMMRKAYRRHYSYVLSHAPKEKLLVYKCSQGWEPLCRFLQLPSPSVPFPHKNVRSSVIEESLKTHPFVKKMKLELIFVASLFIGISAIAMSFIYRLW